MSNPAARSAATWSHLFAIIPLLAAWLVAVDPTQAHAASAEAPSGLEATVKTSTTLTVTWKAVADAPAYRLKYSTSATMKKARYQFGVDATSTINDLKPGKKYYVKVRVVSSSGGNLSPYSARVKLKTLARDSAACPTPTGASSRLNLPAQPRVLLVGDSYTEGVGAVPMTNGYAYQIAGPLGWMLTRDAKGGSGYVNPTGYGAGIFADRLSRHPADGYDLVVIQGSTNDEKYGSPQLDANLSTTLRIVRERYPHAQVLMVGPTNPYGVPSDDLVRVSGDVKAAAASCGVPFIDPLAERWFVPGDGTWAANPDNGHPSNAGYEVIANRFIAGVRALS